MLGEQSVTGDSFEKLQSGAARHGKQDPDLRPFVARALKCEKRRLGKLTDVQILKRLGEDTGLLQFAEYSSRNLSELDRCGPFIWREPTSFSRS